MSMSNKKVLLVGDGNHQFIINLIIWLKKDSGLQIDILSYSKVKEENKIYYRNIFRVQDDNILYKIIDNIKGARRFYRFFLYKRLLSKFPEYDFIHAHLISVDSYFIINELKRGTNAKIILSIWGSDMYKIKKENENNFIKTCKSADILTFSNRNSITYFKEKYSWQKDNLKLCRFGLAPLDNLRNNNLTKEECKNVLGWNLSKKSVIIGYNLNLAQQHLEILKCFRSEEIQKFRDELQLILPITYGGTADYKNEIIDELEQLPFEYAVYDSFLSDDEVAHIRKASDIMIQLQKTDQFSGSMQEHIYTNTIVITGSWLPYTTLKEEGAWFMEIDKILELKDKLLEILKNYDFYHYKTLGSPDVIEKLSSWENNINNWKSLYN